MSYCRKETFFYLLTKPFPPTAQRSFTSTYIVLTALPRIPERLNGGNTIADCEFRVRVPLDIHVNK
jgi:hypothetical protein